MATKKLWVVPGDVGVTAHNCPRTRRKSAPERRANANAQGPCRPKGHDRLMHILYLPTPNPRGGGG